jgi:hypothetical protein
MINIKDLKVGDYVLADYEGVKREGEVTDINNDDKLVCVETEVQDNWYESRDLYPILLNEHELLKLGFTKQLSDNGTAKYMKGSFRIQLNQPGNFDNLEMWWREDKRRINYPLHVHELQNHYRQMTKVELTLD